MRRWLLLGVVLLVGVLPPRGNASPTGQPTPLPVKPAATTSKLSVDSLRRAIEQAAVYLGPVEHSGEAGRTTTQGAMLLGTKFEAWARTLKVVPNVLAAAKPNSHPSLPDFVQARLWALRWLRERPLKKLPKPTAAPVDRAAARSFEDKDIGNLGAILLLTFECQHLPAERRAQWLELLSTPGHGYVLTHQMLGLLLGYNQGCLKAEVAEPLRSRLATQLLAEVRADSDALDTIVIERLAMLCYAGVCNWIDPELITRLVTAQEPSGAWAPGDEHAHRMMRGTAEHTTALAFYVLAKSWTLRHATGAAPKPPPIK